MERIKVLVADDHSLVRAGFRSILGDEDDIDVVGEARDGAHAVEAAVSLRLKAGARAFLLKGVEPQALIDAVRTVAGGDALLEPSVTRRLIEAYVKGQAAPLPAGSPLPATLTAREVAKLEARDRIQLVVLAYESGLVIPGQADGLPGVPPAP
jgi:DNA-binding NarL/FixJ family response regulator